MTPPTPKPGLLPTLALALALIACGKDDVTDTPTENNGEATTLENFDGATSLMLTGQLSCASGAMEQLYCWGFDSKGQLGDGVRGMASVGAHAAAIDVGIDQVEGGLFTTTGLAATGELYGWGRIEGGALGPRDELDAEILGEPGNNPFLDGEYIITPTRLFKDETFTALAYGEDQGCLLDKAGALSCFGAPLFDTQFDEQEGGAPEAGVRYSVEGEATPSTHVAMTSGAVCVVREQGGGIACMGRGQNGELGVPFDSADTSLQGCLMGSLIASQLSFCRSTLAPIQDSPTDIKALVSGGASFCALTEAGTLHCFGQNSSNKLSDEDALSLYVATEVALPVDGASVEEIALTNNALCLRDGAGDVYCRGQVGGVTNSGFEVVGFTQPALAISAGTNHVCAIVTDDGEVECLGENNATQLGVPRQGSETESDIRDTPVRVLRAMPQTP